jgi:hypothetical protein
LQDVAASAVDKEREDKKEKSERKVAIEALNINVTRHSRVIFADFIGCCICVCVEAWWIVITMG